MTDERAMEILDPEHLEYYESIEPVEEAARIGIKAIKRVKELEAENAELRARLNKAGKLPCEVGDTLYEPFINRIREWIVDSIYVFSLGINVNCERKDDCRWHDHFAIRENSNDFESRVYLTREAAEARLKELKENNND